MSVKFGVFLPTDDLEAAKTAAIAAEAQGYYSVSTNDHFYSPLGAHDTPQLECMITLTTLAAATSRIRLAPAVIAASFRTPALLAKMVSTLDIASGGRFICGLGAGWQDVEYIAHGYEFPPLTQRLQQLDETVRILRAMFDEADPGFAGEHFTVEHAYNQPRPVQEHVPIMLGGSGTGLLRIAARHADILNMIPPTGNGRDFVNDKAATLAFTMEKLLERIDVVKRFLDAERRDHETLELGGLCMLAVSRDANDESLRALAEQLGFPDYEAAQRSPVALLGTPDEVSEELSRRLELTGMKYLIGFPATADSQALFAEEVMGNFAT